jgi:hypothetical protein
MASLFLHSFHRHHCLHSLHWSSSWHSPCSTQLPPGNTAHTQPTHWSLAQLHTAPRSKQLPLATLPTQPSLVPTAAPQPARSYYQASTGKFCLHSSHLHGSTAGTQPACFLQLPLATLPAQLPHWSLHSLLHTQPTRSHYQPTATLPAQPTLAPQLTHPTPLTSFNGNTATHYLHYSHS